MPNFLLFFNGCILFLRIKFSPLYNYIYPLQRTSNSQDCFICYDEYFYQLFCTTKIRHKEPLCIQDVKELLPI